ncbi:MAG: PHP domain-containing protein [Clostridia bacterium]|nr:PHP domain-containing protein [Clostridia bacterium]
MACDLHTHSDFSDGTDSPRKLLEHAREIGLSAVALTDHNTTRGLPDFLAAAEELGITAVPGIELSVDWRGREIHLVGLFLRPEHYAELEAVILDYHKRKEASNHALVERLREDGYRIDYGDVLRHSPAGNVNRIHVASALVEKGYVGSVDEAFVSLLSEKGDYYKPPRRMALEDAIRLLRRLEALPVLAHPLQYMGEETLRELLPGAVEAGLVGMEIRHSSSHRDTVTLLEGMAKEFGLLPSGGSDYHGTRKTNVPLGIGGGGEAVPDEIYRGLLAAREGIKK